MNSLRLCFILAAFLLAVVLSGCGNKQEPSPISMAGHEKSEPLGELGLGVGNDVGDVPVNESIIRNKKMRYLSSEQAPFACDLVREEDVGEIMGDVTQSFDITGSPQSVGPVESACLYAYGSDKDPASIGAGALFVRIDVYSDRSYQARGWGTLNEQWIYRTQEGGKKFDFLPDVWAAWVDSDHPPDPALLVRMGDVMFEISYYPPSSSPGTSERNGKIERVAALVLENVRSMYPSE